MDCYGKQRKFSLLVMVCSALVAATTANSRPPGKESDDRFWLAGRYDGSSVVVYFNTVKLGGNLPFDAVKINLPAADGFLSPVLLPPDIMSRARAVSEVEHFAVGDEYELLLGGTETATITMRKIIAAEGDEETGNDSYIGALAVVRGDGGLFSQGNHFVVRRLRQNSALKAPTKRMGLLKESVPFDIESRIVALLTERLNSRSDVPNMLKANRGNPAVRIQPFVTADGNTRYYARAEWRFINPSQQEDVYAIGAWLAPEPTMHILAVETQTSKYGFDEVLPILHNVVYLGKGRTGMVVALSGEDSFALQLFEYRDGFSVNQMRCLRSISTAE